MDIIITVILFFGGIAYVIYDTLNYQKKKKIDKERIQNEKDLYAKNLNALKVAYDEAIKSGNKAQALDAGRKYHSFIRGGSLTIYDEQAITNDLMTM